MSKLYQTTRLPIDEISTSPEFQNRMDKMGTDDQHVENLAQDISQQGLKTRLIVYEIDGVYVLVSGHHRLEALYRIQEQSGVIANVPVKLYQGAKSEAAIHAFRQNLTPGRPLSIQEKQQAAYEALLHPFTDYFRNLSYREAAKQLRIGKSNVSTMHNALAALCKHFPDLPDDWKLDPIAVFDDYPVWFKTRRLYAFIKGGETNEINIMKSIRYQGKLRAQQWMAHNKSLFSANPEDVMRTLVMAEELVRSLKHSEPGILEQLAHEKRVRDSLTLELIIPEGRGKPLGGVPWKDMDDPSRELEYVTDDFQDF